MQADRYSRMVSWLKVLFPLIALALLSTLFLLSRAIEPGDVIPFAEKEIQERLRDQQITGPFFSGVTADGDQIAFSAEKLITPSGETGANRAQRVHAELDLSQGTAITLQAREANVALSRDEAELSGDVIFTSSTGYRISTDRLISELTALNVQSPGPVEGIGPAGTITAGSMSLTAPQKGGAVQLIFKDGVKLVYEPSKMEE
ncbi:LPS export ABC transporter periplasmic protein LptC [Sulfitobacter aestuarii]|uniref:LPS export ABC transporter periplasmic protein LptC n=1 Tax=Sulfitobacter aestuarii TaxID=2161676 RepID=A0ABW5TYS1_9RHOB